MRKDWFEKLQHYDISRDTVIGIQELRPYISDRTLLYGYTCERKTFHVYIKNQNICVVVYDKEFTKGSPRPVNMKQIEVKSNRDYIPDKRLYPERCDYHFYRLLKEKGLELPFTIWTEGIAKENTYYGFTLEDMQVV